MSWELEPGEVVSDEELQQINNTDREVDLDLALPDHKENCSDSSQHSIGNIPSNTDTNTSNDNANTRVATVQPRSNVGHRSNIDLAGPQQKSSKASISNEVQKVDDAYIDTVYKNQRLNHSLDNGNNENVVVHEISEENNEINILDKEDSTCDEWVNINVATGLDKGTGNVTSKITGQMKQLVKIIVNYEHANMMKLTTLREKVKTTMAKLTKVLHVYSRTFKVVIKDGIAYATVQPDIDLCNSHCTTKYCSEKNNCPNIHLCKYFYIDQPCQFKKVWNKDTSSQNRWVCKYGHSTIKPKQNLQKHFLTPLGRRLQLSVLRQRRTFATVPEVCKHYNFATGCRHYLSGEKCRLLHICKYYIQGNCKFDVQGCPQECRRSHDLMDEQPCELLKRHGLDPNGQQEVIRKKLQDLHTNGFFIEPYKEISPAEKINVKPVKKKKLHITQVVTDDTGEVISTVSRNIYKIDSAIPSFIRNTLKRQTNKILSNKIRPGEKITSNDANKKKRTRSRGGRRGDRKRSRCVPHDDPDRSNQAGKELVSSTTKIETPNQNLNLANVDKSKNFNSKNISTTTSETISELKSNKNAMNIPQFSSSNISAGELGVLGPPPVGLSPIIPEVLASSTIKTEASNQNKDLAKVDKSKNLNSKSISTTTSETLSELKSNKNTMNIPQFSPSSISAGKPGVLGPPPVGLLPIRPEVFRYQPPLTSIETMPTRPSYMSCGTLYKPGEVIPTGQCPQFQTKNSSSLGTHGPWMPVVPTRPSTYPKSVEYNGNLSGFGLNPQVSVPTFMPTQSQHDQQFALTSISPSIRSSDLDVACINNLQTLSKLMDNPSAELLPLVQTVLNDVHHKVDMLSKQLLPTNPSIQSDNVSETYHEESIWSFDRNLQQHSDSHGMDIDDNNRLLRQKRSRDELLFNLPNKRPRNLPENRHDNEEDFVSSNDACRISNRPGNYSEDIVEETVIKEIRQKTSHRQVCVQNQTSVYSQPNNSDVRYDDIMQQTSQKLAELREKVFGSRSDLQVDSISCEKHYNTCTSSRRVHSKSEVEDGHWNNRRDHTAFEREDDNISSIDNYKNRRDSSMSRDRTRWPNVYSARSKPDNFEHSNRYDIGLKRRRYFNNESEHSQQRDSRDSRMANRFDDRGCAEHQQMRRRTTDYHESHRPSRASGRSNDDRERRFGARNDSYSGREKDHMMKYRGRHSSRY